MFNSHCDSERTEDRLKQTYIGQDQCEATWNFRSVDQNCSLEQPAAYSCSENIAEGSSRLLHSTYSAQTEHEKDGMIRIDHPSYASASFFEGPRLRSLSTPVESVAVEHQFVFPQTNIVIPNLSYTGSYHQQFVLPQNPHQNALDISSQQPCQPLRMESGIHHPDSVIRCSLWESEVCLCYEKKLNGSKVLRRADNHMINCTKLLNASGISRGRRDTYLKSDAKENAHCPRIVMRQGASALKGVWLPIGRARALAIKHDILELLFPLFETDLVPFLCRLQNRDLTYRFLEASRRRPWLNMEFRYQYLANSHNSEERLNRRQALRDLLTAIQNSLLTTTPAVGDRYNQPLELPQDWGLAGIDGNADLSSIDGPWAALPQIAAPLRPRTELKMYEPSTPSCCSLNPYSLPVSTSKSQSSGQGERSFPAIYFRDEDGLRTVSQDNHVTAEESSSSLYAFLNIQNGHSAARSIVVQTGLIGDSGLDDGTPLTEDGGIERRFGSSTCSFPALDYNSTAILNECDHGAACFGRGFPSDTTHTYSSLAQAYNLSPLLPSFCPSFFRRSNGRER